MSVAGVWHGPQTAEVMPDSFFLLKKLTSNVGRTLLVFLLTPRAKLNACVTSGFTSVVQWVGFEPATT